MNVVGWTRTWICVGAGALCALAASSAVVGQPTTPTPMVSSTAKVSTAVTVVSVDPSTRHLEVKAPSGAVFRLKADPSMHNFDRVKPGDRISATYYQETAYAISSKGKPLPEDTATVLSARAAKGQVPAGFVAHHIVVTGAVLGIDAAHSKLKVVSPKGGEVHEIDVESPEGRALLPNLKVGDKITAWATEALLIAVDPA